MLLKYAHGSIPVVDLEDLYFSRQKCLPSKDDSEARVLVSEEDASASLVNFSLDEADCQKVDRPFDEAGCSKVGIPVDEADCSKVDRLVGEESSMFSSMEDLEAFLGSVPHKIEQGLCSEDGDLENEKKFCFFRFHVIQRLTYASWGWTKGRSIC